MLENHLRALVFLVSGAGAGLILRIALVSLLGLGGVLVLVAGVLHLLDLRFTVLGHELTFLGRVAYWAALGSVFIVLAIVWMPVVAFATSCFLERIADSAEGRYFPELAPARPVSLGESTRSALRIALLTAGIALLLVLVGGFLGPAAPLVGAAATGYVLAREYHDLVARRRLPAAEIAASWSALRGQQWLAGCVVGLAMLVPVLNLFAPIYGVAYAAVSLHDPSGRGQRQLPDGGAAG